MFVIGVAGQAQMGKDTLADRLAIALNDSRNENGKDVLWSRVAFAYNVKKVFCDTFGVDFDFVEKWKTIPENPPGFDMPVRQALQMIGDGFRKIKGTIWLDLVFRNKDKAIIISDVRYENEFIRCKKEGGLNILLARPEKLNNDKNGSEAEIKPYIDWCLEYFPPECKVVDLRKIDWERVRDDAFDCGMESPPMDIELIDFFVRNDASKEDLYKLVDENLLPLTKNYVFESISNN